MFLVSKVLCRSRRHFYRGGYSVKPYDMFYREADRYDCEPTRECDEDSGPMWIPVNRLFCAIDRGDGQDEDFESLSALCDAILKEMSRCMDVPNLVGCPPTRLPWSHCGDRIQWRASFRWHLMHRKYLCSLNRRTSDLGFNAGGLQIYPDTPAWFNLHRSPVVPN